ncbi:uncharacterized protein LOC129976589 isoform X2 [Argiope bruennichi]|uniref:uncharacterized protein LOC129976589 isoform X2 n=1 Tax=Argiope bruennichi TaxID=94029 RepID=UPI00249496D6|nr:uncharacterized protein LOC129976589 isoform X2 [Argiope bruennichi]
MLQELYVVLAACVCFHMSYGQNYFYDASTSSGPLNNENSFQIRTEPVASFSQAQFPSFGPSSLIDPTYQIAPIANPLPVEKFVSELNSAVYSSDTLPDIFDLTDLSPGNFSRLLYDYVYENAGKVVHSNPDHVASITTTPINERIITYTSPILVDIFSNTVAKYLFDKGALNTSNASSLAREYAKFLKESADRNLKKGTPESKVLTLSDGFIDFMNSVGHFSNNAIEEQARYFATEVIRSANKS